VNQPFFLDIGHDSLGARNGQISSQHYQNADIERD
jgi:hypothetical protein